MNEFRAGKALSLGFEIYFANFFVFTACTFLLYLPLILFYLVGDFNSIEDLSGPKHLITSFLTIFLGAVSVAVIIDGTIRGLRKEKADFSKAFANGLRRYVPLIGLVILQTIFILVGSLALIVPGLIIATGLYLSVPICVVEGASVGTSMSRSWELTRGLRMRIFGLVLLVGIINIVATQTTLFLFLQPGGVRVAALAAVVPAVFVQALVGCLSGVSYYLIRNQKEGTELEELAAVFR